MFENRINYYRNGVVALIGGMVNMAGGLVIVFVNWLAFTCRKLIFLSLFLYFFDAIKFLERFSRETARVGMLNCIRTIAIFNTP